MTDPRNSDSNRDDLLNALARKLEALDRDRVGWLSIAPDPAQARLVEEARTQAAAQPWTAQPSPAKPPVAKPPGGPPVSPQPARDDSAGAVPRRKPTPAETRPAAAATTAGTVPPAPPGPPVAPQGAGPGEEAEPAPPPHPSVIATLESLRFQYRDCRCCKLAGGRNRLVFGVGSDRPRLLFVGEGPGAEEDQQGLPFVGRAGALLTGLIKATGLAREDVYITNVVKCRPPGNRNPEPDEIAACRPILQRQIELLAPRLIVALGNVPLKVLKPSAAGITRERGTVFTYGDIPVLPTFHPSYLLRNPAALTQCWGDFRAAAALTYGSGAPPEAR